MIQHLLVQANQTQPTEQFQDATLGSQKYEEHFSQF